MPFGAEVLENGETRFALWAPAAETVDVVLEDGSLMPTPEAWAGTSVHRPGQLTGATYRNVPTGEKGRSKSATERQYCPPATCSATSPWTCWRSRADGRRFG